MISYNIVLYRTHHHNNSSVHVSTFHLIINSLIKYLHSVAQIFAALRSRQEEFAQVIHSVGEFCNALREKVEDYHLQLCLTSVLHDAASHDWPNTKPFFEVYTPL